MIKSYWLWMSIIPFLYLPNFTKGNTGFGELDTADFLLVPLLFLILVDPTRRRRYVYARFVVRPALAFVFWAVLSILLIFFSYDYRDPETHVLFSTLKILKFCVYGAIPLYLCSKLDSKGKVQDYHWMLLVCCAIAAVGVIFSVDPTTSRFGSSYKALNLISSVFAILVSYLTALHLVGYGSPMWRTVCKWTLIVALIGFSLTQGRGGWVATIVAFIFMGYKLGILRVRTLLAIFVAIIAVTALYFQNVDFKKQVDMTLFPDPNRETDIEIGIDDGYRLGTWAIEASKIVNNPIFGTGFFHRARATGLFRTGSHNFWLQIFLETGIVGGALMLFIFLRMWIHGNVLPAVTNKLALPLQTGLVAAFIGGMTGEYFYGGLGLLTLMLIYAPVGGLAIAERKISGEVEIEGESSSQHGSTLGPSELQVGKG